MKAIVTGAAGGIGLHLIRRLLDVGYEVTGVDDFSRGANDEDVEACRVAGAQFFTSDLATRAGWDALDGPFDVLFHLAAVNGTRNFYEQPVRVLTVNLMTVVHGLDWAANGGAERVVWTSSSEAYAGLAELDALPLPTAEDVALIIPQPSNVRFSYASSKIAGESVAHAYAQERGLPVAIVRPHNIYGPRMGFDHVIPEFIERIAGGESPLVLYGGEQTRSFCYVDDATEILQRLGESRFAPGFTVHLGNGREETTIEALARMVLRIMDAPDEVTLRPAPTGSVARRCPDTSRAEALTGYTPQFDLARGLPPTIEWYRAHSRKL